MSLRRRLLSAFRAFRNSAPRRLDADDAIAHPIRASHDATADRTETVNLWANADALDADASNSLTVRQKYRFRSRYERANSGQCAGIVGTQANYLVGKGPKLRMQTGSPGFNSMVEEAWKRWAKTVGFSRKLRTMSKAKTGDGEAAAILVRNPGVKDTVKLDLTLIECDRLTAPVMRADDNNYIDGVHFDDFGNATAYDILERHPGAAWTGIQKEFKTYPAKFVCHWFDETRPGQHRGIPDIGPSLNTFGTGRRWREATVAGAETAADLTAIVEPGITNDGNDEVAPFTTLPIETRTMMALPAGATIHQLKAEQPTSNFDMLNDALISDEARPLHMPRNIAACDSSGYSFSGGMLDHQTYFVSVEVGQQDGEELVVDKVFVLWFEEAVWLYGWNVPDSPAPKHAWAWPARPVIDPEKTANAEQTDLSTGALAPSQAASRKGLDYEDHVQQLADDYGLTVDEMKAKLLESNFQKAGGAPAQTGKPDNEQGGNGQEGTSAQAANRIGHLIHGHGSG